ncbi:MAG TPA: DoxX family protein [Micromonosporaceae bacterium]|nr:DoxX family protein [Micromonosporaceae bacterium]
MFIASVVVSTIVALMTAYSAVMKLTADKQFLAVRDRLGVPGPLWTSIGVLESAAVAGLVAGIWVPALGVAAAAGLVLLTVGALGAHARVRDPGKEFVPAAITLLLAAAALVLRLLSL